MLHLFERGLSFTKAVACLGNVELGILVSAHVGHTKLLNLAAIIRALLLLDVDDLQHANKHSNKEDPRDEGLSFVEDEGLGACAVAAEDDEWKEHQANYDDG